MPNPEIIATLNAAVDVNNSKLFGDMFRQEVYHFHLYSKNNEKELSDLIEYIKVNYSEKYFNASIQSLTDFLFTHQVLDDNGKFELQLNSFCQSLMVSGKIKDRIQSSYDLDKTFNDINDMYNVLCKCPIAYKRMSVVGFGLGISSAAGIREGCGIPSRAARQDCVRKSKIERPCNFKE